MYNFRTDLAVERRDLYKKANNLEEEIDGIEAQEDKIDEYITTSKVRVTNDNGAKAIGKPIRRLYNNRCKKVKSCN